VSRRSVSSSTIRILRALAMGTILWGSGASPSGLGRVLVGKIKVRQNLFVLR
jgi:hypothetical protein